MADEGTEVDKNFETLRIKKRTSVGLHRYSRGNQRPRLSNRRPGDRDLGYTGNEADALTDDMKNYSYH